MKFFVFRRIQKLQSLLNIFSPFHLCRPFPDINYLIWLHVIVCFSILVLYISQNFLTFLIPFLNTFPAANELTENMNNKNSVKWNNDVQPKEFTASRINQITWDDASGRLKITLDGKTIAYIPVVYN